MNPEATLSQLEGESWADPSVHPIIDKDLRRLGNVPMRELTGRDFALLIKHQRALRTAVPLAIELLEENALAEGIFEGDVLAALVCLDASFWQDNPKMRSRLNSIVSMARRRIGELDDFPRKFLEPLLQRYTERS